MKKVILLFFLFIVIQVFGQQDPQYTQYMYNMNVINPAYAGSKEGLSLGLLYRNQWTGFDGAPETGTFFGHAPIGSNLGFGASIIADRIGPVTETNTYIDLSYTLKLNGNHQIAFGLKGGLTFHNIGLFSDITIIDQGDVFFSSDVSETTPNFGAGLFYYTNKYYMAISIPNFLNSNHLELNGRNIGTETQHYFITGGYVFNLSENTKLKPSFLIKSAFDAPTSIDLNVNAQFFEKFEIGASYRTEDSFSALANFAVSPTLKIGYAYDAVNSEINSFAPSSHEVFLLFNLRFTERVSRSPRYF